MVRTREELLASVRTLIGEDNSDASISLIEDITDTMDDYEKKNKNNGEDWEQKYRENDERWRKKYTERFYGGKDDEDDDPPAPVKKKTLTFENLFKEE